jgi:DNA topoisomerase-1
MAETADLRIGEVLGKIDDFLAPHLYPPRADGGDPRACPTCGNGRLHLKTARSGGAFIGCGNYPECRYTRPIAGDAESVASDGRILGQDENGVEISLRAGRFGPYVQRGEATAAQPKPDRASLPKGWSPDGLTLERALALLSLPRFVGKSTQDGKPGRGGDRQVRALCEARAGLCQHCGCRRGLHHRHEPRGRGAGPEGAARRGGLRPRPGR